MNPRWFFAKDVVTKKQLVFDFNRVETIAELDAVSTVVSMNNGLQYAVDCDFNRFITLTGIPRPK